MNDQIERLAIAFHALVDALKEYEKARIDIFLQSLNESIEAGLNSLPLASEEPLLTVKEAAKYLRLDESTIRTWVNQNKIPHLRVNSEIRFSRRKLDQEFTR